MNQILALIAGLLVLIVFTRWLFGISEILKTNKATILLLILIAKKHGATSEEIDQVLDKVYPKQ